MTEIRASPTHLQKHSEIQVWGYVLKFGQLIKIVATLCTVGVGVLMAFGFQFIGPAQINRNLGARIDSLAIKQARADTVVSQLGGYVQFLVVKECLDMTDQKKRDMAMRGISCETVLSGGRIR